MIQTKFIRTFGLVGAILFVLLSAPCKATTMISPTSFSEMMLMSDVVFYGKVQSAQKNGSGYVDYTFEMISAYKGNPAETFIVTGYSSDTGSEVYLVNGDVDYAVGTNYLVFLYQSGDGAYRSTMFANSVYEEIQLENTKLFNQTRSYKELCFVENDQSYVKGPFLYDSLLEHMSEIALEPNYNSGPEKMKQFTEPALEQVAQAKSLCPTPAHCTNLVDPFVLDQSCNNAPTKFQDPTFLVSVTSNIPEDPSNPNSISDLTAAVSMMDNLFGGVDITMDSPVVQNCIPNCSSGNASVSSCSSSVENNMRIMWDDPCDQIASVLSSPFCSGTLARGGSAFSPWNCQPDECGNIWISSLRPYVIVNENAGCSGNNNTYASVLIHEMMHGLGLGHISGSCTAVMNPSVCSSNTSVDLGLTDLDLECVDWMYPPSDDGGGGGGSGTGSGILVKVEAALQGPMLSSGLMNTAAATNGLVPLSQPYNEHPYNYEGSESVSTLPANIVDWVLIELRDENAPGTIVDRRAGFIRNDGKIIDLDGSEGLAFNVSAGTYHVSVNHRTHVGVVSKDPIALPNQNDLNFTGSFSSVLGSNQLVFAGNNASLKAGDHDGNAVINFSDFIQWLQNVNTLNTYQGAENNLDGTINFSDFIRWLSNNNTLGHSSMSY